MARTSSWTCKSSGGHRACIYVVVSQANQEISSDPASPNYGKHWTSDEVIAKFAPDQKTVDAVKQWLVNSGIDSKRITHSDNKGWLAFDATTKEVESLVHAQYHVYEHTATGNVAHAADA